MMAIILKPATTGFLLFAARLAFAHDPTGKAHVHSQDEVFELNDKAIAKELEHEIDISNFAEESDRVIKLFRFFTAVDKNRDSRLDGIEIMHAIYSEHKENDHEPPNIAEMELLVDNALNEQDVNLDGYIDYAEFHKVLKTDVRV